MAAGPGGQQGRAHGPIPLAGKVPPWSLLALPVLVLALGAPLGWTRAVAPAEIRAVTPDGRVAADGFAFERLPEGTASERGIALPPPLRLEVELPAPTRADRIVLQANHNDWLRVTAANAEGLGLGEVWTAPRLEPPQLRTRRSPRLSLGDPVLRLRVESLRGRAFAVSDLSVRTPRLAVPAWTLAIALWVAFAGLFALRAGDWLARWRRADLRVALALAGVAVPGLAWPAAATLVVDAGVRLAERGRDRTDRSWGDVGLLVLLAVAGLHYALVTRGGETLVEGELLGAAYDSLADSLAAGDTAVERWAIKWEAFEVERGVTTYFGPLPALLRVPAHGVAPTLYGRWSRVSCLAAAMLAVAGSLALFRAQIERNERLPPAGRRALLAIAVLGAGLASPLAFMPSVASIYHEAPLWALAFSLWGAHFALALAREPERPALAFAGLAACAGLALLSRVTFGLPLYAVLAVAGLATLRRTRRVGALALWTSPALLLAAFQLWYNFDRFGSAFTFIDWRGLGYLAEDEASWRILQENGTFQPARLPSALWSYFGFRADAVSAAFPFLQPQRPSPLQPELYPPIFVYESVISLTLVSGWLVAGAVLGCVALVRRAEPLLARVLVAALAGQTLLVLCYYIVTHRYALDFLPFLLCASSFFFADLGRRVRPQRAVEWLGAAVLVGVAATTLSTLAWIPRSAQATTPAYKERVQGVFDAANAWLGIEVADPPS